MSYKFETMSPQMLNTIARNKLSILNISDAVREKILEKLNQYHITGSSIDNIAKAIDSIQTDDEQESYNSITPGDFGRLSDTIRFMNSEAIDADYIISELCHIQEEKQENYRKQIGFMN